MSTETSRSTLAAVRDRLAAVAARPRLVVAAITVLALAVRLFGLGARVAHQDEARVAYWAYRYMETGVYWYRPIVHGPFLTIVNSYVFSLLGASDFTMRLVVAVVGGLLPLAALLFRHRLRDGETIALGLVLAANPILLYYSRFYRNDLLLAGFMLVAFGFFVRAYDHRRPAFLYLGTAVFALAFTTKENALLYPVTWIGAAVLLFDRRVLIDRMDDWNLRKALLGRTRQAAGTLRDWGLHFVLAVVEFFTIFVFFYAPRGKAAGAEPTLGATLADPTLLPALVGEAVIGSWTAFVKQWGSGNQDAYLSTTGQLWSVLEAGALVLLALAVVGFLMDRYTGEHPRDVVAFATYWGIASVLGYPIAVDNPFPWEVIHIIVPLAIPAAVGAALLYRKTRGALEDTDPAGIVVAVLLVIGLLFSLGLRIDVPLAVPVAVGVALFYRIGVALFYRLTRAEVISTDPGGTVVAVLFVVDFFVVLGFYTGTTGTLDYPLVGAFDVPGSVVLVVALALTVAVGAALLYRKESEADPNDIARPVVTLFLVVLVVGQVGVTAYDTSFAEPQSPDNELVQYAQSSSDMKPLLGEIRRAVEANNGTDVLYYGDDPDFGGDELYAPNPRSHSTPIAGDGWFERLPFAWYLEAYGAETNSTADAAAVRRAVQNGDRPPVVIAFGEAATCSKDYDNASDIDQYLQGYERHEVDRFLFDSGCTISSMVVYVDENRNTAA